MNDLLQERQVAIYAFDSSVADFSKTEIDSQIRPSRFIAYQSPLSSLKSYRFNSGYHNSVKDGYRSLTFSYDIDPKEPLCPTELAGETCSDPTCDSQHFRQMALAGAYEHMQTSQALLR